MRQVSLKAGQRVTLSDLGKKSLEDSIASMTGSVARVEAKYPDSIAVITDGENSPRHYNRSFWIPLN